MDGKMDNVWQKMTSTLSTSKFTDIPSTLKHNAMSNSKYRVSNTCENQDKKLLHINMEH